jgi:hypothetical protein
MISNDQLEVFRAYSNARYLFDLEMIGLFSVLSERFVRLRFRFRWLRRQCC